MCFKYGMTPGMFWYLFLLLVAEASAIVKNSIRKKGHRYVLLQTVICILSLILVITFYIIKCGNAFVVCINNGYE